MTDTGILESKSSIENNTTNNMRSDDRPRYSHADYSKMHIPQLRSIANKLGVPSTSAMRKSELIASIEGAGPTKGAAPETGRTVQRKRNYTPSAIENSDSDNDLAALALAAIAGDIGSTSEQDREFSNGHTRNSRGDQGASRVRQRTHGANSGSRFVRDNRDNKIEKKPKLDTGKSPVKEVGKASHAGSGNGANFSAHDDDDISRRRGRRFRERRRSGRERAAVSGSATHQVHDNFPAHEDDSIQPVAGILDILDNYAFLRTTGYLPGSSDVYVSMNFVRRYGLRRGDHIAGGVKISKDTDSQGNNRQKFNPLVRLDSVNGKAPEQIRSRPDFSKLVPLYPNERLRLETKQNILTTRVIDIIMPIGKGQRALIVSPPKAGKTTILQDIANAIAINNPECYLMVVLVDERPEEVTDMQRSVKGEVISSTFDRPPSDHTAVAELAIERAKRLVEDGQDVVVLLDSITRLGRSYNNSSPASGRILSGGVDSTALYPPKRFLGAARNIEDGGSLTIIATAMVETGSTGDTVIFEEFKGTGNAELKLDRKIAERRVFPAVDVVPSSTRKDELLLNKEEANIVHKLRRVLSGLDSHQAIDLLIGQLKKTKSNYEFLVSVNKSTPSLEDEMD